MTLADIAERPAAAAQAATPCCVTGLVTMAGTLGDNSFALADRGASAARAVYVTWREPQQFAVGQVLEVKGVLSESFFACGIQANACTVLAEQAVLPPAPRERLRDLDPWRDNLRRVCLKGVVQQVVGEAAAGDRAERLSVRLGTADGAIDVRLDGVRADWLARLDDEVSVEGTLVATFTRRRELLGMHLEVSPLDAVAPVSDPDLAGAHARSLAGVVTYVDARDPRAGFFVLQSGGQGAAVRLPPGVTALRPGQRLTVDVFSDPVKGQLPFAVRYVEEAADVPLPEPVDLRAMNLFTLAESAESGYDDLTGRRAVLRGTLIDASQDGAGAWHVALSVPDGVVRVHLPGALPKELAQKAADQPTLEAVGVARLVLEDGSRAGAKPRVASAHLYVADAADAKIVDDARWRLRVRRQWALGGALTALLLGLVLLVGRVVRDRRQRQRLVAVAAERKRMSADLHDTIEQNLASAKMMLNVAVMAHPETPAPVADVLRQVSALLMRTKQEIRAVIWNLRSDALFEKRPSDALGEVVATLAKTGTVRIRADFRELPARIPGAVLADLVALVQESLNNAVRHGGATRLALAAERREKGYALRLRDNGAPFDPETAPGPETGHFGLSSLRERARRSNLGLTWLRTRGRNELKVEGRT